MAYESTKVLATKKVGEDGALLLAVENVGEGSIGLELVLVVHELVLLLNLLHLGDKVILVAINFLLDVDLQKMLDFQQAGPAAKNSHVIAIESITHELLEGHHVERRGEDAQVSPLSGLAGSLLVIRSRLLVSYLAHNVLCEAEGARDGRFVDNIAGGSALRTAVAVVIVEIVVLIALASSANLSERIDLNKLVHLDEMENRAKALRIAPANESDETAESLTKEGARTWSRHPNGQYTLHQ